MQKKTHFAPSTSISLKISWLVTYISLRATESLGLFDISTYTTASITLSGVLGSQYYLCLRQHLLIQILDNTVNEFIGQRGDHSYICWLILPGYFDTYQFESVIRCVLYNSVNVHSCIKSPSPEETAFCSSLSLFYFSYIHNFLKMVCKLYISVIVCVPLRILFWVLVVRLTLCALKHLST